MTLIVENFLQSHINTAPIAAHKEKDYPSFWYIQTIRVFKKPFSPPKASETVHSPINSFSSLSLTANDIQPILTSPPHPNFKQFLSHPIVDGIHEIKNLKPAHQNVIWGAWMAQWNSTQKFIQNSHIFSNFLKLFSMAMLFSSRHLKLTIYSKN